MFGSQDPYVELKLGDGTKWNHVTEPQPDNGAKAKWKGLEFTGKVTKTDLIDNEFKVRVKDKNDGADKFIGKCTVSLSELVDQVDSWVELSGQLLDKEGNPGNGDFVMKARFQVSEEEEEAHGDVEEAMSVGSKTSRPPPTPSKDDISRASENGNPTHGDWSEIQDAHGQVYYYNTVTGETSWTKPGDVDDAHDVDTVRHGDWVQHQDENGNFYWYNELSGESAWELPSDEPEEYHMNDDHAVASQGQPAYASASAGGYTIEL